MRSCDIIKKNRNWVIPMETVKGLDEKTLDRLKRLKLMDDNFMSICFDNALDCMDVVLHSILGRDDLEVCEVVTQKSEKSIEYRSVIFDILATDRSGNQYDIEIQKSDSGASFRRARYYSSVLDTNLVRKGSKIDTIPDAYTIFITENDVIGENQSVYNIDRYMQICGSLKPFEDGEHIIYVNGSIQDDTPVGRLMHDFTCTDPNKMYYQPLADRVRYFKEHKEGVKAMCEIWEEIKAEGMAQGIAQGKVQGRKEAIKILLEDNNYTVEKIAKMFGLSTAEVIKLKEND